jgi:hypothetical protein
MAVFDALRSKTAHNMVSIALDILLKISAIAAS